MRKGHSSYRIYCRVSFVKIFGILAPLFNFHSFSLQAHARTAVIFQELRKLISNLLTEKIGNPEIDIEGKVSFLFVLGQNLRTAELQFFRARLH